TFGRTEFRRRWGDRQLEDNWRRLNKASRTALPETAEGAAAIQNGKQNEIPPEADNKKPEYYLRDLPLNDSLLRVSNQKIAIALLEAGKIYHENFADNKKATVTIENLIQRFPGSSLEPDAFYTLYNIYREENNTPMAEIYRQRLIEKYPESEFAKIISDPSYFNRKLEENRQAEKLYEEAYNAWLNENFSTAVALCNDGLSKFSLHELAPKFQLLKSYCVARTEDERTFKEELNKVIKSWPDTPEAKRAEELIAFLNQEIPELKIEEDKQTAKEIYTEDKDSPHLFVLAIIDPSFNINQATFDVISYNIDNYTNRNFRTTGELVENKYIMITVAGFKDLNEAMEYYNAFNVEKEIRNQTGAKIIKFIIGRNNFAALQKDMNPDRYRVYFVDNYLGGKDDK
ncbi:MAG TPA: hypothetical protein PLG42_05530, partial [Bacteroidales bacterium]|nr:hypothetical protein [Bacteroidales bacterium]